MLVATALAGLVLVVVLAAGRPRAARHRRAGPRRSGWARDSRSAGARAGTRCRCSSGPAARAQRPARRVVRNLAFFVEPAGAELLHTPASAAYAGSFHLGTFGGACLPGLAAADRPGCGRGPVLAGPESPCRGRDLPGAGAVQPRRRQPAGRLRGLLPVELGGPAARPGPGAAGPVLHPRGRGGRSRARVLPGPGAGRRWPGAARSAGPALAACCRRGRGAGGRAADPGAVPDGAAHASSGGLAGGLCPAAARHDARVLVVPVANVGPDPGDALAGGYRRARR